MQLWSEKWLLCFHPDKCECTRIGKSDIDDAYKLKDDGKAMKFSNFERDIGVVIDNKLTFSNFEKDIGVVIDNKLTFENHNNEKVNEANSVMGIIRRTFELLDTKTFRLLYTAMVRLRIEYANQV